MPFSRREVQDLDRELLFLLLGSGQSSAASASTTRVRPVHRPRASIASRSPRSSRVVMRVSHFGRMLPRAGAPAHHAPRARPQSAVRGGARGIATSRANTQLLWARVHTTRAVRISPRVGVRLPRINRAFIARGPHTAAHPCYSTRAAHRARGQLSFFTRREDACNGEDFRDIRRPDVPGAPARHRTSPAACPARPWDTARGHL